MIVLNADESMLLLLTKCWEHKDHVLKRNKDGRLRKNSKIRSMRYIQECMNIRCFGTNWKKYPDLEASVWGCYEALFEKLLTPRAILDAYRDTQSSWRKVTMLQALISQLAILKVQGEISLDYSNVDHTGKKELMEANPCQTTENTN
jgi:hypothetical protein